MARQRGGGRGRRVASHGNDAGPPGAPQVRVGSVRRPRGEGGQAGEACGSGERGGGTRRGG